MVSVITTLLLNLALIVNGGAENQTNDPKGSTPTQNTEAATMTTFGGMGTWVNTEN